MICRFHIVLLLCFAQTVSAIPRTGWFIPSNRFSSSAINDVCQDRDGYIWIATDYGVNRFDGYRFTTYLHRTDDSTTISSNIVGSLYSDADGSLWLGTARGLDRYNTTTGQFEHCRFADGARPRVTKMLRLDDGRLIVGTSGYHGFYVLNGTTLTHWDESGSGLNFVNSMTVDRQGRFWQCGFGNEFMMKDRRGLHRMTSTQGFVIDFALRGDEVLIVCLHGIYSYRDGHLSVADIDMSGVGREVVFRRVCTDRQGNIYIGTRGDGLYCLPASRNGKPSAKLERVEATAEGIDLNTAKVWAIAEDRLGNLWLGCQSKGLLMLQRQPPLFRQWSFPAQGVNVSSAVTSICEGDRGMTWCTVQGNGIFGFDSLGHIVAHPVAPARTECIYRQEAPRASTRKSPPDRRTLATNRTQETSHHFPRYWVGTGDALYAYDPLTGQSQRHLTFDCDKFSAIVGDSHGRLYISVFSKGILCYDPATRQSRHFTSNQKDSLRGWLCNDWVLAMMTDSHDRLWLATSSGISCYDPQADNFHPFGWHQQLGGTLCYSLCETRQGDILVGTENGLFRLSPYQGNSTKSEQTEAMPFPSTEEISGDRQSGDHAPSTSLRDKVVAAIVEAPDGNLWCATSAGLWQWDVRKQQFIGHVNGNGLTQREYISSVGMQASDGTVCFANNEGLTVFRPQAMSETRVTLPDVCLTNFVVAGKPRSTDGDCFEVSYLDNMLTLEFSLMDFNNPGNVVYEYRIGDSGWLQNAEGQNSVQLSRLQPGRYNIEVRALAAGVRSATKVITVDVTPPWYRSTAAYIVFFLAFLALLALLGWVWRRRQRMQLEEEKMKFLINATHDIRSPLTLIMGSLGKLKNSKVEELKSAEELQSFNSSILQPSIDTIDRNAQRLMLLVNQILDERRIDKNQLQLHCRETNLVDFVGGICKLYQFNASQRDIAFSFDHDKENVTAWIDRVNFDKVIANLLSNAFKYTHDGGEVKVVLCESEHDIEIRVIDNGAGIKDEDKERLFDRFYQGRNADSLAMQGTGIGLNLSKNIVQMHGGRIKAENNAQQGACFVVTIPKGNSHLKPDQIVTDPQVPEPLTVGGRKPFREYSILIVDDDPEIAAYITAELGNKYKFGHALDGREAMKMLAANPQTPADKSPFDLVISDVLMPGMDGITLLKHIKGNPAISHLPVILLTSKTSVSNRLEGLKSGADAYLPKPFNMEELHIQIDNLLDSVRRLRGKFSGALQQEERIENIEVKGNDEALMERIMRSVNAHISDSEFNVDMLAADVGISRAQLHRKLKEMTGVPTGKFLRNLRMEQAARLLREGKVNVAQVADCVGYADQSHFSTAFKTHFGIAPSEYIEAHRGEKADSAPICKEM